jgi:hypothetical protein
MSNPQQTAGLIPDPSDTLKFSDTRAAVREKYRAEASTIEQNRLRVAEQDPQLRLFAAPRSTKREAAKEKIREEARRIEQQVEEKQLARLAALEKELDDALLSDDSDEVRVSLMLPMGLISGDTDKPTDKRPNTAGHCRGETRAPKPRDARRRYPSRCLPAHATWWPIPSCQEAACQRSDVRTCFC